MATYPHRSDRHQFDAGCNVCAGRIIPTRAQAAVTYTSTRQTNRLLVNLNVDGTPTTIAITPNGTLQRLN